MEAHSWFPRSRKKFSGYLICRRRRRQGSGARAPSGRAGGHHPSGPTTRLVGQQQADGLETLLAAVHVIPQEQIVGLGRVAPVLEQPQQVRVLPVDIACTGGEQGSAQGPVTINKSARHFCCDCGRCTGGHAAGAGGRCKGGGKICWNLECAVEGPLPQILIGASSSNKFGWLRKISLALRQSWRIS